MKKGICEKISTGKKITLSNKNILAIFKKARKTLDRMNVPPIDGGFIFTPYGAVMFRKNKFYGSKRAISWVKRMFKPNDNKAKRKGI